MSRSISLRTVITVLVLCLAMLAGPAVTFAASPMVKNVIVLISDGCGYNTFDASDYYQFGKANAQSYNKFPVQYGVSTYAAEGRGFYDSLLAWGSFDWLMSGPTDSAAAATALSCGQKTYNAALGYKGTSAGDSNKVKLKNLVEEAEELGKSTGVISTVQFSHATPAGYVAHNVSRNNYAEIAQEMINVSKCEVIMGAGHPWYDDNNTEVLPHTTSESKYKYVGGSALWNNLLAGTAGLGVDADHKGYTDADDAWQLIQDKTEFQSLMTGPTPKRVCGVAKCATTTQQTRGGDVFADPNVVPFNANVPSLTEMTRGALNVLDNNSNGFFLMVEGGAIDWAGHANQKGRIIEEQIDFNSAVDATIAWVEENSNWNETLVIITADHETGYLTGPQTSPSDNKVKVVNNGQGVLPGMAFNSSDHTNSLVPIFAKGAAAASFAQYAVNTDSEHGLYIDNTDIWRLIHQNYSMLSAVTLDSSNLIPFVGSAVNFTTTVTGGEQIEYKFQVINTINGEVVAYRDYADDSTYSWTPKLPGRYTVTVFAHDVKGNINAPVKASVAEVVKYDQANVKLTLNVPATFTMNSGPLTLEASVNGTTDKMLYRFIVRYSNAAGVYSTAFDSDYNYSNTAYWTPTAGGRYSVTCYAMPYDKAYSIAAYQTVTVFSQNLTSLNLEFSSDKSKGGLGYAKANEAFTMTATHEPAGLGNLKYRFVVTTRGTGTVIFDSGFTTEDTCSLWTPTEVGSNSIIRVYAIDAANTLFEYELTYARSLLVK